MRGSAHVETKLRAADKEMIERRLAGIMRTKGSRLVFVAFLWQSEAVEKDRATQAPECHGESRSDPAMEIHVRLTNVTDEEPGRHVRVVSSAQGASHPSDPSWSARSRGSEGVRE